MARGSACKKYKQGESSAPACSNDKCDFYLPAFFETSIKRFFVRANSGRKFIHNGHSLVPREFADAPFSNIPKSTLETAKKLLEGNVPTNMINSLIQVMDNNTLSPNLLRHLQETVINEKHGRQPNESTGTTLLQLLKEKEGCDLVYLHDWVVQPSYETSKVAQEVPDKSCVYS